MDPSHETGCKEYIRFYQEALDTSLVDIPLRDCTMRLTSYLHIVALDKITVHADRGLVISLL